MAVGLVIAGVVGAAVQVGSAVVGGIADKKAADAQATILDKEAAFATIYTGEDMDTSVTYDTDGVTTIDATGGLVYDHLLEISLTPVDVVGDHREVALPLDAPVFEAEGVCGGKGVARK